MTDENDLINARAELAKALAARRAARALADLASIWSDRGSFRPTWFASSAR